MVEMALLETAKLSQVSLLSAKMVEMALLRAKMVEMALLLTTKTLRFLKWEPLGSKWRHPKTIFEKTIEGGIENH